MNSWHNRKEDVKLVVCNLPPKKYCNQNCAKVAKKKMRDANDYTVGLVYIVGK